MTIDMHAHFVPKGLADALAARPHLKPVPGDDVGQRVADMDRNGIVRAVLSNRLQDLTALPLADSVPLCRAFNDAASAICVAFPDRFLALAALPTAEIGATVAEFERAMALPGMVGAILPGDGFLSARRAERFRPVLEAADARRAVLLVHASRIANDPEAPRPDTSDNARLRAGTLDMQARLSSNMITFCLTDLLVHYPNLTMMSHNLGGNIPFEVERLDHRSLVDRPQDELPSKRIRAAPVLVDCNSLGARSIERAVEVYGAARIVFGSDGTDFGMRWSQDALAEARIAEADKRAILWENAAAALGRVAGRLNAAAQ